MSKEKPVVIGESMVQRLMELAGNRAFYKKSIIKESEVPPKEPKEEEEETSPEVESDGPMDSSLPPEDDSALEGDPVAVESDDIVLDTDIDGDGDGDGQPINMDQFIDELAELMMRATNRQVTVGPSESDGIPDEDIDLGEEPLATPEEPQDIAAPETTPMSEPMESDKKLESRRVSKMAQKIYEQVMTKIVKKSGIDLNEAKKNNQEVKVKLEPKNASAKKPLNEAKDGQPHQKAPFLTSKTTPAPAKGRGPDKPGKSPSPHPQPVKSSPKSNQNANSDVGKKK